MRKKTPTPAPPTSPIQSQHSPQQRYRDHPAPGRHLRRCPTPGQHRHSSPTLVRHLRRRPLPSDTAVAAPPPAVPLLPADPVETAPHHLPEHLEGHQIPPPPQDPAIAAICPHCSRRGPGHQPRRHRVLPPASTAIVASLSSASTTAAALCPRPTRRLPPSNQPGALAGPSPASATNHPPINGAPLGICATFWSNALLCKLQSLVLPCSRRSRRAAPRHHVQLINKDSEGVAATFQM
ncbi:proline-rich receptor-like protein kinase PERK10 [Triticum urartu]|nr:proline-rich receptor-like protein kinase PERK10 [Triticum urartu]